MANEDATKDELQEELRRRDLPVSGTKDELQDRLEDAADDRGGTARKATSKKQGTGKATSKKSASGKQASKKASKKSAAKRASKKSAVKRASKKSAVKRASKKSAAKKASKKSAAKKASEQTAKKQGASGRPGTSRPPSSPAPREAEDRRSPAAQQERASTEPPASSGPPKAGEVARLAARQLAGLTRHQIEGISGLGRDDAGWRVEVEVVEVHRVPSSTDVMGTYAVYLDGDGELVSYERVERFVRGQASGGEG